VSESFGRVPKHGRTASSNNAVEEGGRYEERLSIAETFRVPVVDYRVLVERVSDTKRMCDLADPITHARS
jgi:hypothetical protein